MGESIDFIKDRALKTLSAANQVQSTWTSQEAPFAALQAGRTAIVGDPAATPPMVGQEAITSQKEQAMLAARGAWDAALDQLHRWTVQGVGMAKNRFRGNAAKLGSLSGLTAKGGQPQDDPGRGAGVGVGVVGGGRDLGAVAGEHAGGVQGAAGAM